MIDKRAAHECLLWVESAAALLHSTWLLTWSIARNCKGGVRFSSQGWGVERRGKRRVDRWSIGMKVGSVVRSRRHLLLLLLMMLLSLLMCFCSSSSSNCLHCGRQHNETCAYTLQISMIYKPDLYRKDIYAFLASHIFLFMSADIFIYATVILYCDTIGLQTKQQIDDHSFCFHIQPCMSILHNVNSCSFFVILHFLVSIILPVY